MSEHPFPDAEQVVIDLGTISRLRSVLCSESNRRIDALDHYAKLYLAQKRLSRDASEAYKVLSDRQHEVANQQAQYIKVMESTLKRKQYELDELKALVAKQPKITAPAGVDAAVTLSEPPSYKPSSPLFLPHEPPLEEGEIREASETASNEELYPTIDPSSPLYNPAAARAVAADALKLLHKSTAVPKALKSTLPSELPGGVPMTVAPTFPRYKRSAPPPCAPRKDKWDHVVAPRDGRAPFSFMLPRSVAHR